jgi:hypothetical protein
MAEAKTEPDQTMHSWSFAQAKLKSLEGEWTQEIAETKRRRDVRYQECDIKKMRALKQLAPDAVYTPRRIADKNIRRELAPDVAYISQARDLAKFQPMGEFSFPIEPLEREFTRLNKHRQWQRPFFQVDDGSKTHGWDAVETLFDPAKPGHSCTRHIGHEFLIFPTDICDIQEAPYVEVLYATTITELESYTEDFDFDPAQVSKVKEKLKSLEGKGESKVTLKKVYFKEEEDGQCVVYVGWGCEEADDWLLAPDRLSLGSDAPEYEYPIDILEYDISENEVIAEAKGRVFLDEPDQEACTQILSRYVTRWIRSTYVMTSPKNVGDETSSKQTDMELGDGKHICEPTEWFNIDPPDPTGLGAMQAIVAQNSDEAGQVSYAVNNRKDSRKTATEVQSAEKQGATLGGVRVTLLSDFMASVLTRRWNILKAQVLAGKIASTIPGWQNYYNYEPGFNVLPAGDVEVVRRAEIVQAMKQDWPVIQQTAAAEDFLKDLMRFGPYGENAEKYIAAIGRGNRKDNLIEGMKKAIEDLIIDPQTGQPRADVSANKKAFLELLQEYMTVMHPEQAEDMQKQMKQGAESPATEGGEPYQAAA